MAKDLDMPNFNLGDDFDKPPDSNQTPIAPEGVSEEAPKAKPRLLFEDNQQETKSSTLEPEMKDSTKDKKGKSKKKKESKGKSKKGLILVASLVVIIIAGIFFLNQMGYMNINKIMAGVGKFKNSIFGGKKDTTHILTAADSLLLSESTNPEGENKGDHKGDAANKEQKHDNVKKNEKSEEENKSDSVKNLESETPQKNTEEPISNKQENQHNPKIDSKELKEKTVKEEKPVQTVQEKNEKPVEKPKVTPKNEKPVKSEKILPKKEEKNIAKTKTSEKINLETKTKDSKLTGKFWIQVSSWQQKSVAEREVKKMTDGGYSSYIKKADLPEKGGIWYRVIIGNFNTKKEAEAQLEKIKTKFNTVGLIKGK